MEHGNELLLLYGTGYSKESIMQKFKMELVWHNCDNCLPEEDYNPCLYVTDGHTIMPMRWKRDSNWQRFENDGWYIEQGINSNGYWWADIQQTIRGTKDFIAK